ncbi:MAG: magnetic particle specific iron-binding protein [Magnetococcales bacterium]|nr:magnetic particle specific iron-binding protein [Magnetococcales bacterium]
MGFHGPELEGAAANKGGLAAGNVKGAVCKGGVAGKGAAVGKGAVAGKGAAAGKCLLGPNAATTAALPGSGAALGAKAAAGAGAKGMAAGGTIWTGSGTSLGLGLGLGAWGPILLVGAVAAVGVGIYSYMKRSQEGGELEEAIS